LGAPVRELLDLMPWSETSLGDPSNWPQPLRAILDVVLDSKQPMFLVAGPDRTWFHNDAFIPIMGHKHPSMLGKPSREVWSQAWSEIGPMFDRVFRGEATHMAGFTFALDRSGTIENADFDFSHTPIKAGDGTVVGLFGVCVETTDRSLRQRRDIAAVERERDRLFEMARSLRRGDLRRLSHVDQSFLDSRPRSNKRGDQVSPLFRDHPPRRSCRDRGRNRLHNEANGRLSSGPRRF
jgi:hypothetical protein